MNISNFDIPFWAHFSSKKCTLGTCFEFLIIFSNVSVIYAYNCTWTFIWHHRPKIVDQSEISATPRASRVSKKSKKWKIFCCFFHYFPLIDIYCRLEARGVAEISDQRFLAYDVIWVFMFNYMHIWHSYLKIWSKTQKIRKKYDFFSKNDMQIYIKFRCHDIYDSVEWWKNDLETIFCYKTFDLISYFKNQFSDRNFCPPPCCL